MNELSKIASSTAELRKRAADLAAQLADLSVQQEGINERLTKLEQEDDAQQSFPEATAMALAVAFPQASELLQ
jgi:chaperonin cofactor prefoldin